jgi:putative transposase
MFADAVHPTRHPNALFAVVIAKHEDQNMERSRFPEEQIIGILKEHELGAKTAEVCRKHGISEATFYIFELRPRGKKVLIQV